MDEIQDKPQNQNTINKNTWIDLVEAVKTPIGFFVFAMLLVEAFLSVAYSTGEGNQKNIALWGMLAIAFLVIIIVTIFVYKNNSNLFLVENPVQRSIKEDELSATQLKILHFIKIECGSNLKVSQTKIEEYMNYEHCSAEFFYRLETLICQNFIRKKRSPEQGQFLYWPLENDDNL